MAGSVKAGKEIEAGVAQALFGLHVRATRINGSRNQYVPAPDGKRFLVINLIDEGARPPSTVVSNWTAALRK
jgi:hypothetical protein